jgi:hypothetical protein
VVRYDDVNMDSDDSSISMSINNGLLTQEQIQTELGFADVYLVEARSIGGLSGCPVFVRPSIRLPQEKSTDPHTKNVWAVGHGTTLLG